MPRLLAFLTVIAVGLSACGDGPERADAERECPEGTPSLKARDVIGGTPDGYVIDRGDQEAIAEIVGPITKSIGSTFRDYDARVLARRGAASGTIVLVVNAHERAPSSEGLIQTMTENEEKTGATGEDIVVGGTEGRLSHAADGGYLAMAPAGDCAMVMLIDPRENRIRDAAVAVLNDGPRP